MAGFLSNDEIEALLKAFDEPVEVVAPRAKKRVSHRRPLVASQEPVTGTTMADIARENNKSVRHKKVVKDPDYLHITEIAGQKYYSSPGSTVLQPEEHARKIFDFSKIRGFIRG